MPMSHLHVPSVLGWGLVLTGAGTTPAASPGEEGALPGYLAWGSRGCRWFHLSPPQIWARRLRWALSGCGLGGHLPCLCLVPISAPGDGSSQLPAGAPCSFPHPPPSFPPCWVHPPAAFSHWEPQTSRRHLWKQLPARMMPAEPGREGRSHPAPRAGMCHPSPTRTELPEIPLLGWRLEEMSWGGWLGMMDAGQDHD